MKKYIKIVLWSIIGCIVIFILYLNYQTYFSEAAKKGSVNIENIKKVREKMGEDEVLSIMGSPDAIHPDRFPSTQYWYATNDDSYAHVKIIFDSTMKVQKVYYPKNQ